MMPQHSQVQTVAAPRSRLANKFHRGSTLVEFAATCLVFLTLMFSIIDFSIALYTYDFVGYAAQEAVRYAIVRGAKSGQPATATDVTNYVKSFVLGTLNTKVLTVNTTWAPDNNPGSVVSVVVSYSYAPLTRFIPATTIPLTRTAAMVISQ